MMMATCNCKKYALIRANTASLLSNRDQVSFSCESHFDNFSHKSTLSDKTDLTDSSRMLHIRLETAPGYEQTLIRIKLGHGSQQRIHRLKAYLRNLRLHLHAYARGKNYIFAKKLTCVNLPVSSLRIINSGDSQRIPTALISNDPSGCCDSISAADSLTLTRQHAASSIL